MKKVAKNGEFRFVPSFFLHNTQHSRSPASGSGSLKLFKATGTR